MFVRLCCVVFFSLCALGCGAPSSPDAGDPQLPPITGSADVESWLAQGHYKAWKCEPAPHAARSPSPHAINRICNNSKLAAQPAGPGEYPVGAAAVKELFSEDAGTIIGYAVEVHVSAGTNTSNWYWYERNPSLGAPAKNGVAGVVADGIGPNEGISGGPTEQVCTSCHRAAGSDAAHQTTDSHDFVYTHVP